MLPEYLATSASTTAPVMPAAIVTVSQPSTMVPSTAVDPLVVPPPSSTVSTSSVEVPTIEALLQASSSETATVDMSAAESTPSIGLSSAAGPSSTSSSVTDLSAALDRAVASSSTSDDGDMTQFEVRQRS
uniref:Uncharacterized protein n=1 Tax=Arundo donax TaxID=35708 RepID=A0A0A9C625_ARUDO